MDKKRLEQKLINTLYKTKTQQHERRTKRIYSPAELALARSGTHSENPGPIFQKFRQRKIFFMVSPPRKIMAMPMLPPISPNKLKNFPMVKKLFFLYKSLI